MNNANKRSASDQRGQQPLLLTPVNRQAARSPGPAGRRVPGSESNTLNVTFSLYYFSMSKAHRRRPEIGELN